MEDGALIVELEGSLYRVALGLGRKRPRRKSLGPRLAENVFMSEQFVLY